MSMMSGPWRYLWGLMCQFRYFGPAGAFVARQITTDWSEMDEEGPIDASAVAASGLCAQVPRVAAGPAHNNKHNDKCAPSHETSPKIAMRRDKPTNSAGPAPNGG